MVKILFVAFNLSNFDKNHYPLLGKHFICNFNIHRILINLFNLIIDLIIYYRLAINKMIYVFEVPPDFKTKLSRISRCSIKESVKSRIDLPGFSK